jgi:hypothetical protein
LGPARREGEARGPQTGSVRTRRPSISTRSVECPYHVSRSPLAGGFCHASSGFMEGRESCGTRLSPPHRNSLILGIETFGSRRPARIECRFWNRPSAQRGDALMRSRRAPFGLLPRDFMVRTRYRRRQAHANFPAGGDIFSDVSARSLLHRWRPSRSAPPPLLAWTRKRRGCLLPRRPSSPRAST